MTIAPDIPSRSCWILANVLCSPFDQRGNLLWVRNVDRVAGSRDLPLLAARRVGYQPLRSGLIVLSPPATNIQLGFLLHAAVVMTALKLSAKFSTCDRAMKAACSADRSAAKYS